MTESIEEDPGASVHRSSGSQQLAGLNSVDASITSNREWVSLIGLLIAAAAVRLPFWPLHRELGDSLNYSIGALVTHVAHPPGSIGYCLVAGWVNRLFHNIAFTLLFLSFMAAMAAIVFCHRLAKSLGMTTAPAIMATALYAFSINTCKASLMGGPHIVEGLCSILFAWLVWQTVRNRQRAEALLATAVFAICGAFRPTTMPLLIPLWLFMLYHSPGSRSRLLRVAQHLLIAVPIIAAWQWGNSHYMRVNGYGGQTYQTQVLTSSPYDFDSLNSGTPVAGQDHLTYHMPGAELLSLLEVKTGLRLMPHVPGWPAPSFSRAMRLIETQILKQGWWMVISLPLVALIPVLIPMRFRELGRQRQMCLFFALWILPSIAFFILGHMGMLTYIQVYLGGLCLFTTQLLFGSASKTQSPGKSRIPMAIAAACVVCDLGLFTLTRPFRTPDGIRHGLDLVLLQYDGYSIHNGFNTSRRSGTENSAEGATGAEADYINAPSDELLIEAAWRNHYPYLPAHR